MESVILFLAMHLPPDLISIVGSLLSLLLTATLIAGFYHAFCPLKVNWRHLIFSAMVTATLWMLMRPAFGLFLSVNKSYGAIFGSMKAMFVSISWLYLNFAVFLIGIELMVTLRQKDVLLLKGLFDDLPNQHHYLHALMRKHGKSYAQGEVVFAQGSENHHYYMVLEGTVQLLSQTQNGTSQILRILKKGDFFGEIALFSFQSATASAIITSRDATLIEIDAEHMDNLLQEDPKIAVRLLKQLSGNR